MLIPLMLMSVLVLGLRHRYTYPRQKRPLPETLIVGLYLLSAVGLCLSYFPYHRFVLFLSLVLLVVIALNNQFFLFLAARRGRAFAVAAIPFQLLYFFYCGVAYAIGWTRYRFRKALALEPEGSPAAPTGREIGRAHV